MVEKQTFKGLLCDLKENKEFATQRVSEKSVSNVSLILPRTNIDASIAF